MLSDLPKTVTASEAGFSLHCDVTVDIPEKPIVKKIIIVQIIFGTVSDNFFPRILVP